MRRGILLAATALAAAAIVPAAESAHLVVQGPSAFTTSNAPHIAGWWWLRTANASATWTFSASSVRGARVGSVYLLFAPLVTNRTDGGSGYARSIKVIIRGQSVTPAVTRTVTSYVGLYNPFRPILNEDTHGVGYQTYGNKSVSSSIWRPSPLPPRLPTIYNPRTISVTIQWTAGYHVAVNRDAVRLSYSLP